MRNDIVLSSRVRLARNYEDIPFDVSEHPEFAAICVSRTVNALKAAGVDKGFELFRLRDMSDASRKAAAESRLISRDLLANAASGAALIRAQDAVTVMMGEDDHLRIQAIRPEMDLLSAATACFRVDDALSRQVNFAFDEQLGYLTACPTNTGTGMRASLLMHLPLLTKAKKMGDVGQLVAKVPLWDSSTLDFFPSRRQTGIGLRHLLKTPAEKLSCLICLHIREAQALPPQKRAHLSATLTHQREWCLKQSKTQPFPACPQTE